MDITLKPFQDRFLFSNKRFVCLTAGVGTGKTMMMLLKIWRYCEEFPKSSALVIRREYSDLESSTIKDFERYFNVSISAKHEFKFSNGSTIMFKHGKEVTPNVLKNFTLDIVGVEQAEEFETDSEFTYLRDRLRGKAGPYRQICLIANANGHNWIWKNWKNNPKSEEYDLIEATTFDNSDNLPPDFIEDLKAMKDEAPNHYARFVMNSWEDTDSGDLLVPFKHIQEATARKFLEQGGKVISVDVARFGDDKTVFTILQRADGGFKMIHLSSIRGQDLMQTVGQIIELKRTYGCNFIVIDDCGVGGGVTDRLMELEFKATIAFNSANKPINPEIYNNRRSECYFKLKELFESGRIQILNDEGLESELSSIKFMYKSNGQKVIESKDDMKKRGLKSPDKADALMMCMSMLDQIDAIKDDTQNTFKAYMPQQYSYRPHGYSKQQSSYARVS